MNLQIRLQFDETSLRKYDDPARTPFFGIALEYENQFYPAKIWTDFGARILNWWIEQTLRVLQDSNYHAVLDFMDGPYSVTLHYKVATQSIELRPQSSNSIWEIPMTDLIDALIQAAEEVGRELDRVGVAQSGIGKQDREALKRGIGELQALAQEFNSSERRDPGELGRQM